MIHQENVLRFPMARRLMDCRERVFDGNARFPVDADTTDDQLNAMAENIFAEDGLLVDVSVYVGIRVGLGKARDRARAKRAGVEIDEVFFDSMDKDMMQVAAELYELRHG
jgi:hypothetical protein